jgi:hypothetical protein
MSVPASTHAAPLLTRFVGLACLLILCVAAPCRAAAGVATGESLLFKRSSTTNPVVDVHIDDSQGTATIADRDASLVVQTSNGLFDVSESARRITVIVNRPSGATGTYSVFYETVGQSASDRSDFSAAIGTVRLAPDETSKSFDVFIIDDVYAEASETFTVNTTHLSGPASGFTFSISFTIIDNDAASGQSPVKNGSSFSASFFVRQHYLDFFNREPDLAGLNFWTNQTLNCGNPDLQVCRENVSAAFFVSTEFQQTGYFVYKMYQAAFDTGEQLRLRKFLPDTQEIGRGIIVNQGNWQERLEANKRAYADEFVSRQEFIAQYPSSMSAAQFVDKLNANTGHSLTIEERDSMVSRLSGGAITRAEALREVAENAAFSQREYNRAFVLMQYFGYLRRNPNDAPELNLDYAGYNFWLTKLNNHGGNYITSQMVRAFITSGEYEQRFGL